ncbi:uncharacterized protein LOC127251105 [Andrographis paniculata]|uniref:uncharacterized protein LOC127251105 n=1 Tax=Andrographis paniculata TaxID=175694 RepID=UPI0021E7784A|nr:uncharacterized protein LOC127251105 [Andrographis paniculata]
MSRTFRDQQPSLVGAAAHRRRLSLSLNALPNSPADDNLDLFSKTRRHSSHDSDASVNMGRLSMGSLKSGKTGLDDLLSSAEGGKNDYDWLLTPPGTPLAPSSDGIDSQTSHMASRRGSLARSISTTKASRLSVTPSEKNHAAKPMRSSSVTRSSVSGAQYTTYSNKSTSILNTSSASVSSYIRSSTPTNRSSAITKSSTTTSHSTVSRSTTPSKPRPSLSMPSVDKPRQSQNSRPSTPTSRSQMSACLNPPSPRTTSRPSTPVRRNPTPSLSPASGPSIPGARVLTNGRSLASVSRPSSPGPRVRTLPQPVPLPDFPLETPPNLRTTLPDRPLSAGRSRPGVAHTAKGNVETASNISTVLKRSSSPVIARGRLSEHNGRRILTNGQLSDNMDSRREMRKPVKASTDNTGFGRTISKKSLDMAIRHMDIRNGSNAFRPLTGSNLFPQSIRPSNQRIQAGARSTCNVGAAPAVENGHRVSGSDSEEDRRQSSARLNNNIDIYESTRYDMILLKEDLKNTNWLHSVDDKSDQGSIFDNGFETLPEPFAPL